MITGLLMKMNSKNDNDNDNDNDKEIEIEFSILDKGYQPKDIHNVV
jgi:hypothetical protein